MDLSALFEEIPISYSFRNSVYTSTAGLLLYINDTIRVCIYIHICVNIKGRELKLSSIRARSGGKFTS